MFPRRIQRQSNFVFGPDIYRKLIPEDHILKINKCVDFSFVNKACRDLYSENQGRPVKNLPETMFRSAIIEKPIPGFKGGFQSSRAFFSAEIQSGRNGDKLPCWQQNDDFEF